VTVLFAFCVFFVSPIQIYHNQNAIISDRANTISRLTNQIRKLEDAKPTPIHDAAMILADEMDEAANQFHQNISFAKQYDEFQAFDDRFFPHFCLRENLF
jgi:hypothetical protein